MVEEIKNYHFNTPAIQERRQVRSAFNLQKSARSRGVNDSEIYTYFQ